MKPETYVVYLETVVLSLLAERQNPDSDITSIPNDEHPSFRDVGRFSPYIIKESIERARRERRGLPPDRSFGEPMDEICKR